MRLQSAFMQTAQTERPPLSIYLIGGIRLTGTMAGEDGYTVLIVDNGRAMLVYKHAIAAIVPARPMDLRGAGGEAISGDDDPAPPRP